ncbi:MAG: ABC-F family ATP-binding cassette domain-containing protein [Clostridia bacterium]|nr:ABC-F family ATP-binding cassette domain-containing protein [Clostridia bacterium]
MILAFDQVVKSYFGRTVLDGITFRLDAGARIGLIGPNGSGKTTLLRLAEGLETPDAGTVLRASGMISGYLTQDMDASWEPGNTALFNAELAAAEKRLREMEHELAGQKGGDSPARRRLLEEYSAATARFETQGGYEYERTIRLALEGLGLSGDILERPVASLSGGERMRVRLARLLVRSPDLLLLDEPTNHLDMAALDWLEEYLRRFRGAVLVVSHDRAFLDRTVTGIAELAGGRLRTGIGNYTAYMQQKRLDEAARLREMTRLEKEMERQQGVVQTMLSHRKMSAYHARERVVRKLSDTLAEKAAMLDRRRGPSMKIRFLSDQGVPDASRVLIRTEGLSMSYGGTGLFRDVGFVLRAEDRIALAGPNGCGKTTLLRILLGEETAQDGRVWLSGTARMGYMGQFSTFSDEDHTIEEETAAVTESDTFGIRSLLARFGFRDADLAKRLRVLSGGERSRLYLCLMLESHPDVLLLDEPTNHLDIESREILESALLEYPGAILAVSHDRYFIARCCRSLLGFHDGTVTLFDGYEPYRMAVSRPVESAVREPADPPGALPADGPRTPNRAEERRRTAARQERLRRLEREILEMEEERDGLERAFGADTPPETYAAYADLVQRIDSGYEEFLAASDEP